MPTDAHGDLCEAAGRLYLPLQMGVSRANMQRLLSQVK